MFRNILVAVDGSVHAAEALGQAIDLTESERGRLTLLTAQAQPRIPPFPGANGTVPLALADARSEAEAIMREALTIVPPTLPVTTIVTRDPIQSAVIGQIDNGRHDLVVVGSRGRGALRSIALGSVSHHILHHSPVPVLIIHAEETALDPAASGHPPAARSEVSIRR